MRLRVEKPEEGLDHLELESVRGQLPYIGTGNQLRVACKNYKSGVWAQNH